MVSSLSPRGEKEKKNTDWTNLGRDPCSDLIKPTSYQIRPDRLTEKVDVPLHMVSALQVRLTDRWRITIQLLGSREDADLVQRSTVEEKEDRCEPVFHFFSFNGRLIRHA